MLKYTELSFNFEITKEVRGKRKQTLVVATNSTWSLFP